VNLQLKMASLELFNDGIQVFGEAAIARAGVVREKDLHSILLDQTTGEKSLGAEVIAV